MSLVKNIKRYFSFKELIIVLLAVIISISAGVGVFLNLKKEVVINDNGNRIVVKTMKTTVKEVLDQNGITVGADDYLNPGPENRLQRFRENRIDIKRAVPVKVLVDGNTLDIMTYKDTVKEVLQDENIRLAGNDRLDGAGLDDKVQKDMSIRIIRVKEQFVTEDKPIPFRVINRENNSLDKGTERVVKEGKEGIQEKVFRVIFEDGIEIARNLVKDSIALAPVDKVIEFGTVLNHKTARGDVVRYKKVMDMRATAYTASYKDTGKSPGHPQFGITYTGMKAKKGVIAVDPKVIPLGTKVYVEVAGSTPDYGFAVAADIGGAIKGDLIDLYFDDQSYVDRWGCKKVKVYILNDQ